MSTTLVFSLARFSALVASLGYLSYTVARIFWFEPGQDTMSEDMFFLVLAGCLVMLALLVQRRDSRVGRFLASR